MKKITKQLSLILSLSMILGLFSAIGFSDNVSAKSKVCLNKSLISLYTGKTKKIYVKKTRKKAVWKIVDGKKNIKISNSVYKNNKNCIKVKAIKKGNSKIVCAVAGKILICNVKVKSKEVKKSDSDKQGSRTGVPESSSVQASEGTKTIIPNNIETAVPTVVPTQTSGETETNKTDNAGTSSPVVSVSPKPVTTPRPTHIPTNDKLMKEENKVIVGRDWIGKYYFFGTDILRDEIEVLYISDKIDIPKNRIGIIDLSEKHNRSVMAWYTDVDGNGEYEMTIGQEGGVVANPDSSYLFSHIYQVKGFENLYTSDVVYANYMFSGYGSRRVTDHPRSDSIYLDIGDDFDTSNIEEAKYMFSSIGDYSKKLYIRLGRGVKINEKLTTGNKGIEDNAYDWAFSNYGERVTIVVPDENVKSFIVKNVSIQYKRIARERVFVEGSADATIPPVTFSEIPDPVPATNGPKQTIYPTKDPIYNC